MAAPTKTAFKILTAAQWSAWRASGTFTGAAIDLTDGYIHLSTAQTAGETYARYFADSPDKLVVAEVDLAQLGDSVKWEASRGGELFPHVYGAIPVGAVVREWEEDVNAALFDRLVEDDL